MDDINVAHARLLVVGINPGGRSEAVNAPFAHPGNRFWPAMYAAGITPYLVDATHGLSVEDHAMLRKIGLGFTNIVSRTTAKASELTREEYREGGRRLEGIVAKQGGVMVSGIGAYRIAMGKPKATTGPQEPINGVPVWVVGNPSGLNAHETVDSLAEAFRQVWESVGPHP